MHCSSSRFEYHGIVSLGMLKFADGGRIPWNSSSEQKKKMFMRALTVI